MSEVKDLTEPYTERDMNRIRYMKKVIALLKKIETNTRGA